MALDRPLTWNPGGGRSLRVLPLIGLSPDAVLSDATPATKPGYTWTDIYATPGTLSYNCPVSDSDAGHLYSVTIRGLLPGDTNDRAAALRALQDPGRLLAQFTDNAGGVRRIGTATQGLILTYNAATGNDAPDSRGYDFTLTGQFADPPTYTR